MKDEFRILIIIGAVEMRAFGYSSTKEVSDKDHTVDFTTIKTFECNGWADNSDEILTRLLWCFWPFQIPHNHIP